MGGRVNYSLPGGRLTLINHVLLSVPMHALAAFDPPKAIVERLEAVYANCFWGSSEFGPNCHWIKWNECCFPVKEGGIGLRSISDVIKAFSIKLWWNLRTSNSLWGRYMHQK